MRKQYEDRILLYGCPRLKPPQKDPHPELPFHAIEVSNLFALKNFITFYVKRPISAKAEKHLEELLPNPGYHDPGFFHREEPPARVLGYKQHYHILFDHIPTRDDVKMVVDKLEELGEFYPEVKRELKDFYNLGEDNGEY